MALSGKTYVSQTVKDLIFGSGISLESVGKHELKGIPGIHEIYKVV